MRRSGLIRVMVATWMGCLGIVPCVAHAQSPELAVAGALPAPRLIFSESEMALAAAVAKSPGLADFYGTNGLRPIFGGHAGAGLRAALIAAVGEARGNGLPPARYHQQNLIELDRSGAGALKDEIAFAKTFANWTHDITGGILDPAKIGHGIKREVTRPATGDLLRAFAKADDPAAWLRGIAPQDRAYLALRAALGRQSGLVAPAGTPTVPAGLWRQGDTSPEIGVLRVRLAAIGFDARPVASPDTFDAPLVAALAAFQAEAGLPADGVAGPRTITRLNRGTDAQSDAILVALERMRWMHGQDLNARHVWVNLPEYNARIMENGHEVFETRAVIGKPDEQYETPEFSETMKYIVVNPRWNVPRSITVKEYLPRLKANRNAVSHIDVVDGRGNVIARNQIDFGKYTAANFPYRMRQKPSDDNALGAVKFMFPNPWNIYLHDTPTKHLFNESRRAFSHGCIRIGRPMDLAHELLVGTVADPEAVFAKALATGRETYLNLRPPVPVHLVYFTAFPDEIGVIRRYPDIYGRDALVYQALVKAGLETGARAD